nr:MAG: hemolysin [Bacteriophage sp.]UWG90092.1 MAG: hemolysin [Bacteriophage sp.]
MQTRHRERRKNVDDAITRAEHEEFRKRLEEQNQRQDKRIALLEESVRQIGALTTSVEKLALSMESMAKEQERQGERMEVLEGRDGEMWRKVVGYIVTAVIGIVLGFVFTQIGM